MIVEVELVELKLIVEKTKWYALVNERRDIMSKHIHVLVLCANGAVTSTIVLSSLKESFEEVGISATFVQKRVVEGAQALAENDFDLVISTAGQSFAAESDVPVLSGVPFLTGIGKEEIIERAVEISNS